MMELPCTLVKVSFVNTMIYGIKIASLKKILWIFFRYRTTPRKKELYWTIEGIELKAIKQFTLLLHYSNTLFDAISIIIFIIIIVIIIVIIIINQKHIKTNIILIQKLQILLLMI